MPSPVDLYDSSYAGYSAEVYREVRQETYGRDLGQTSWMTVEEFHSFFPLLNLHSSSRVLEVGCGASKARSTTPDYKTFWPACRLFLRSSVCRAFFIRRPNRRTPLSAHTQNLKFFLIPLVFSLRFTE